MDSYRKQFFTVLGYNLAFVLVLGGIAISFWSLKCDGSWHSCLGGPDELAPNTFLFLSIIRPLLFTPLMVLAFIGSETFGVFWGTILTALGATLACMVVYMPGKHLGKKLVRPWLSANLPATWRFLRTQDYKIVFASRWIPLFPFDLFSLLFGVADFRAQRVAIMTFVGVLPEAYMYSQIATAPDSGLVSSTIISLTLFGSLTLLPLFLLEFLFRKRGSSMWAQARRTYYEIVYEARINNSIMKRTQYSKDKVPIILLYGFFSSRRSLTVMERLLTSRGFDVMSFNLGGSLGVFFTRGIRDTAQFIDRKIKRQIERHGFENVQIVAHSKGGLVALWWILKLGGSKYCKRLITMGTPYKGSYLTYLALVIPLGFFWRDVWQMRPGSEFLNELNNATLPEDLEIYCCYSSKDKVAGDTKGLFEPAHSNGKIYPVPMHKYAHFEFLYKRGVGDTLAHILGSPAKVSDKATG